MSKLSNLQSDDGKCRKENSGNPEAHRNFRFVPRALWPVGEDVLTSRNELLREGAECVMNRRAFEYALHDSLALSPLKVLNLKNDTQIFNQEYTAENGD
jgi:hypothetical protein